MVNKKIILLKKGEYFMKEKIKQPFMIYVDFENILIPKDNGKQNLGESYTNNYQKHFSKPFISCLGKEAVYNFINSIGQRKYILQ